MDELERRTLRVLARMVNPYLTHRNGHLSSRVGDRAVMMGVSALDVFIAHGLVDQEPGGRATWTRAGLDLLKPIQATPPLHRS